MSNQRKSIKGYFSDKRQKEAFEEIIKTLEDMPMEKLCTLALSANIAILKKWNQKN